MLKNKLVEKDKKDEEYKKEIERMSIDMAFKEHEIAEVEKNLRLESEKEAAVANKENHATHTAPYKRSNSGSSVAHHSSKAIKVPNASPLSPNRPASTHQENNNNSTTDASFLKKRSPNNKEKENIVSTKVGEETPTKRQKTATSAISQAEKENEILRRNVTKLKTRLKSVKKALNVSHDLWSSKT